MSYKNKVALVTGGSRGIGREVVLSLIRLGCKVAFNYKSNSKAANELMSEVEDLGGVAKNSCVDISDFEKVKEWIDQVKSDWGGLDILVNNAGITIDKPLMMMSPNHWQDVINTNLNGMFNASKACIITFMKQKSGVIVNISSVSGVIGLPGQVNYSASKGGMNSFTKALAKEVAPFGVRVNAIAPGFIETEMLADFSEDKIKEIKALIPVGHLGSSQDVANCVKFLLSDQSLYITGQVLQVDGGLAMR